MNVARARAPRWITAAVFAVALALYASGGHILPGNDTRPAMYLPSAVLDHGAITFSPVDYPFMFRWAVQGPSGPTRASFDSADALRQAAQTQKVAFVGPKYYVVETASREYVSSFGVLPGLLAIPATLVTRVAMPRASSAWQLATAAYVTSALLVALSVAFVFAAAARLTSPRRALLVAFAYGAGTCVWSLSSQALWQHAPCALFLSLAATFMVLLDQTERGAARLALALSLAVWSRPTAAVAALVCAGWMLWAHRARFARFTLAALPFALALVTYNLVFFDSPWKNGQVLTSVALAKAAGADSVWGTPLWLGAAGLLFSPARGLVVHSPVLLFSAPGIAHAKRYGRALWAFALSALAMSLIAFHWYDWWGGWSYGYRPLVDTAPFLALLMVPAIDTLQLRSLRAACFALTLAWSVVVQVVGAYAYDPLTWNNLRDENIDRPEHRARLWQVKNTQAWFFAKHFKQARALRLELTKRWIDDPRI